VTSWKPCARRKLGSEPFRPQFLNEVPHTGQSPVLTVAELAEQLGDGPGELDCLFGLDEDIDVRRHPLAVGKPTAGQDVEAESPVGVPGRPQTDVVDLGLSAVFQAPGDADLEFAGQVGVVAVAGEERRDVERNGQGVEGFVGVDARDGAAQTLRAESPQAWTVVSPTSANRSQIRGTSPMRSQWIWIVCRVVMSA
jgi:hypothetical protein